MVSDELWNEIAPLVPPRPPRRSRYPGRKHLDDRKVLRGILFVIYTAIPWDSQQGEPAGQHHRRHGGASRTDASPPAKPRRGPLGGPPPLAERRSPEARRRRRRCRRSGRRDR
ncbi:transposase [Micromonospora sp. NPDC050686]|uniref:transposase n=1 Tax=Micromonospora sp. NPDC050686 TaxID=3154631 RepID=UPI003401A321